MRLLTKTGFKIAPVPGVADLSSTTRSGNETYPSPLLRTWTATISPLSMIGASCAFLPSETLISGFLWRLSTVDP